jgi:hypothetical protein
MELSRRELLRVSGGISTGVVAGLSGCTSDTDSTAGTSTDPPNTSETPSTTSDASSTTSEASSTTSDASSSASNPLFDQWLLPPDQTGGNPHYGFLYQNYETIRENEAEFDDNTFEIFEEPLFDDYDLDMGDITATLQMDPLGSSPAVVTGSFDKEDVIETIENSTFRGTQSTTRGTQTAVNKYEQADDIGDYTVYTAVSGQPLKTIAVKSGTLFSAPVEESVFETALQETNGEVNDYADSNDDMDTLLDELDSGTFIYGTTTEEIEETDTQSGVFEGQVASGYTDTVDGETTSSKFARIFADEADINMDEVDSFTDTALFDDFENISVTQDGRKVMITGDISTDDLYT